jgi:hypothetical protein
VRLSFWRLPGGWAFDDEFECRTLQSGDRQLREQRMGIMARVSSSVLLFVTIVLIRR